MRTQNGSKRPKQTRKRVKMKQWKKSFEMHDRRWRNRHAVSLLSASFDMRPANATQHNTLVFVLFASSCEWGFIPSGFFLSRTVYVCHSFALLSYWSHWVLSCICVLAPSCLCCVLPFEYIFWIVRLIFVLQSVSFKTCSVWSVSCLQGTFCLVLIHAIIFSYLKL